MVGKSLGGFENFPFLSLRWLKILLLKILFFLLCKSNPTIVDLVINALSWRVSKKKQYIFLM